MIKDRLSLPPSRASRSVLFGVRTRLEQPPLVGGLLMLALLLAVAAGIEQRSAGSGVGLPEGGCAGRHNYG